MATLNVTIKEEIELYGEPHGGTTSKTISNITKTYKSIIPVDAESEGTNVVYSITTAGLGGAIEASGKTKYLRITNLDETAVPVIVYLVVKIDNGVNYDSYVVKLDQYNSFVLFNDSSFAEEQAFTNNTFTLDTVSQIEAYTSGNPTKIEIFAASIN